MKSGHGLRRSFISLVAFVCAAFAMIGSANATSASTDVTDLWWNANKSGNGYPMIQTGTFVFATGFVFGEVRQPFWFSAELELSGPGVFSGPLFVTTGPYFGGPYDPTTVINRQAGTMTFTLTTVNTGNLSYTIDGVVVNEPVSREPLTLDDYNGSFISVITETRTGCLDPANDGVVSDFVRADIVQNGDVMTIELLDTSGGTCTVSGTYSQLGRSGALQGTSTCSDGDTGNALLFEMNNHFHQFNARTGFTSMLTGCTSAGRITGLILN